MCESACVDVYILVCFITYTLAHVLVSVYMSVLSVLVCACYYVLVCVCVCVKERERERERMELFSEPPLHKCEA
jgi:Flp pilus assembly protein TadB